MSPRPSSGNRDIFADMKSYLEIRDSEGGRDAKDLVAVMADTYVRAAAAEKLTVRPHV